MKNMFRFSLIGIDSLSSLLLRGIKGYAINSTYGLTTTIWLYICDGPIIAIQSTMNELGGWEEIGTLIFTAIGDDKIIPEMIPLPAIWREIVSVEKLLIDDNDFVAASGFVIRNGAGDALTVTCGAEVYSIQMQASFFVGGFNPEYDFERYKSAPLEE